MCNIEVYHARVPAVPVRHSTLRTGVAFSPLNALRVLQQRSFEMSKHNTNPQDLGWTHKGANEQSKVEFYEKDGVKMDYYYTTGTVKTSMDHPSQGKTQMFRRDLSEDQFQSVCQNPRYHTGQGYQTKSSKYYKW